MSVDDTSIKDINTTINKVKTDLNTFLSSAEIGNEAIDTLKEIQSYINSDSGTTVEILENISKAQTTGENAQTSADNAHKNIEVINSIIGEGFDSSSTISDQFYTLQTNVEDNELVTSSALNNLNARINDIPDEVFIGETIDGAPEIFIDVSENETIEIYTQKQINDKLSAITINANLYADEVSNNVLIGNESSYNKGNILIDTTENVNVEVYTKSQVDAIIATLEARIRALEN